MVLNSYRLTRRAPNRELPGLQRAVCGSDPSSLRLGSSSRRGPRAGADRRHLGSALGSGWVPRPVAASTATIRTADVKRVRVDGVGWLWETSRHTETARRR